MGELGIDGTAILANISKEQGVECLAYFHLTQNAEKSVAFVSTLMNILIRKRKGTFLAS